MAETWAESKLRQIRDELSGETNKVDEPMPDPDTFTTPVVAKNEKPDPSAADTASTEPAKE